LALSLCLAAPAAAARDGQPQPAGGAKSGSLLSSSCGISVSVAFLSDPSNPAARSVAQLVADDPTTDVYTGATDDQLALGGKVLRVSSAVGRSSQRETLKLIASPQCPDDMVALDSGDSDAPAARILWPATFRPSDDDAHPLRTSRAVGGAPASSAAALAALADAAARSRDEGAAESVASSDVQDAADTTTQLAGGGFADWSSPVSMARFAGASGGAGMSFPALAQPGVSGGVTSEPQGATPSPPDGGLLTAPDPGSLAPITAPVPESATWVLLLAGFGGIGAQLRRRSAHKA
jgi:hypothetical protein